MRSQPRDERWARGFYQKGSRVAVWPGWYVQVDGAPILQYKRNKSTSSRLTALSRANRHSSSTPAPASFSRCLTGTGTGWNFFKSLLIVLRAISHTQESAGWYFYRPPDKPYGAPPCLPMSFNVILLLHLGDLSVRRRSPRLKIWLPLYSKSAQNDATVSSQNML